MVVADWLIAGLFVSSFDRLACTFVSPHQSPEDLRAAVPRLAAGETLSPPATLFRRFEEGAVGQPDRRAGLRLEAWQLETGCGLALGLTNGQIAAARGIAPSSARLEVHRLLVLLKFADREAAASSFKQALTS